MSDVNGKEILAIQDFCSFLMNLAIYMDYTRAMVVAWVPSHRGVIFLLFDMVLRMWQKKPIYW